MHPSVKPTPSSPRLLHAFGGVVAIALVALASRAGAQDCSFTCNVHARACLKEARTVLRSCTGECRGADRNSPIGPCFRKCFGSFLSTKGTCRGDQTKCLHSCAPSSPGDQPPGTSCRGGCGWQFAGCVRRVVTQARQCARACGSGPDRGACQAACTTAMHAGSTACRTSSQSCLGHCGGSPGGAFLGFRSAAS
jgi:hypothetical protein